MLKVFFSMRPDQLIYLNLNDNDLGPEFFSLVGIESFSYIKDLQLSNTRLNNKSMQDLSELFTQNKS